MSFQQNRRWRVVPRSPPTPRLRESPPGAVPRVHGCLFGHVRDHERSHIFISQRPLYPELRRARLAEPFPRAAFIPASGIARPAGAQEPATGLHTPLLGKVIALNCNSIIIGALQEAVESLIFRHLRPQIPSAGHPFHPFAPNLGASFRYNHISFFPITSFFCLAWATPRCEQRLQNWPRGQDWCEISILPSQHHKWEMCCFTQKKVVFNNSNGKANNGERDEGSQARPPFPGAAAHGFYAI